MSYLRVFCLLTGGFSGYLFAVHKENMNWSNSRPFNLQCQENFQNCYEIVSDYNRVYGNVMICYDLRKKMPRWVCERLRARQEFLGDDFDEVDKEKITSDSRMYRHCSTSIQDYETGKKYVPTFLASPGNYIGQENPNVKTAQDSERGCYMTSNLAPMANCPILKDAWATVTKELRNDVSSFPEFNEHGEVFMLTGSLYRPIQRGDETWMMYNVIGQDLLGRNKISVPTHYFKCIIGSSGKASEWWFRGFVVENKKDPKIIPSVKYDWLEKEAGLILFKEIKSRNEKILYIDDFKQERDNSGIESSEVQECEDSCYVKRDYSCEGESDRVWEEWIKSE